MRAKIEWSSTCVGKLGRPKVGFWSDRILDLSGNCLPSSSWPSTCSSSGSGRSRCFVGVTRLFHPVWYYYCPYELLHGDPAILRHSSQLGIYLRIERLHELCSRYSSTLPKTMPILGYNTVPTVLTVDIPVYRNRSVARSASLGIRLPSHGQKLHQ